MGKGRNDGQINKNDSKDTKQIDLTERVRLLDKNTERRKVMNVKNRGPGKKEKFPQTLPASKHRHQR